MSESEREKEEREKREREEREKQTVIRTLTEYEEFGPVLRLRAAEEDKNKKVDMPVLNAEIADMLMQDSQPLSDNVVASKVMGHDTATPKQSENFAGIGGRIVRLGAGEPKFMIGNDGTTMLMRSADGKPPTDQVLAAMARTYVGQHGMANPLIEGNLTKGKEGTALVGKLKDYISQYQDRYSQTLSKSATGVDVGAPVTAAARAANVGTPAPTPLGGGGRAPEADSSLSSTASTAPGPSGPGHSG